MSGAPALIRGDFIHARFEVRHEQARRVAERSVGISSKMRWIDAETLAKSTPGSRPSMRCSICCFAWGRTRC